MSKTYIFGHRRPDTDSVMAAIALSYLKNQMGYNTEARILGDVNRETIYALSKFNLKEPKYLNDVKLQLKDTKYHKGFFIHDTNSIYDGYQKMINEELTGIPIAKSDGTYAGLVTLKDLSYNLVNENTEDLYTSYDNILHVLKGEEIVRCDEDIIGKLIVAAYRSTTFISNVELENNNILIVGDRHSVIEYAIESKVKLIILSGDSYIKEEHIKLARENKVNIIRSSYGTYRVSRLISLANYIKTMINHMRTITFRETDYVSDVLDVNYKQKHTNYPVIDKHNKVLGLLKITDLSEKIPKKVILVDHNEVAQSAEGIEEAEILEIVDHHALGSITTSHPINYRNMVVGSTSTIVYELFKESRTIIPKNIAGALISGILSDTLILKSPTTTDKDRIAVGVLAKIAEVNYEEYGMDLLRSGTSLEGLDVEDVIYQDYKIYTVGDKTFSVGQFFTMNFDEIRKDMDKYIDALNHIAEANRHQIVALYVTDIVKNGSYVIYNNKAHNLMTLIYSDEIEEGYFIDGCLSRKKHIVPVIMQILES